MMRYAPVGVLLLAAASAHAEPGAVEVGNYRNSGRVVLEVGGSAPATWVQRGNQIVVTLPGVTVTTPERLPRNVVSFSGGQGSATITVDRGTQVRPTQTGRFLTLDMGDPRSRPHTSRAPAGLHENPAWSPPVRSAAASPDRPPQAPLARPASAAGRPTLSVENQSVGAPGVGAAAADAGVPARAPIQVPASPDVGAMAFRRGDFGLVVFDDNVELPLSDGDDKTGRPTLQQLQGGTILTLPLGPGESIILSRNVEGWVITVGEEKAAPTVQTAVPEGIAFQFGRPGRAMTISDPVTGQTLLLGTSRKAGADHARIDERRAAPGYVLLPTWLGVAVEVTSDQVDLRASHTGFTLQIPDRSAPGTAVAAVPDNRFGIPNAPNEVLLRRLDAEIASAASAPPRGRGAQRVAAARTMLALGMGPEAQALLGLAANDDPNIAADPTVAALSGIAAVLAHRPGEATGLDNSSLAASNDVALWRGLRDLEQGNPPPSFGKLWPILMYYPESIRRRIEPPVIEAAVGDGDAVPDAALQGPAMGIARAVLKQKSGDVDAALSALDEVSQQRDERDSVRARVAATELRLSNGKITPGDAAEEIERQTARWRGDRSELAMRLRVAELRTAAGQWRSALEGLRETEALFPESKERVTALKAAVFTGLLAAKEETLNPLEIVTIVGDFADCLPTGKDGERLAGLLAEKLEALDLPARAIPVLERLVDKTDLPAAKAELGLRLAQLEFEAGDLPKAEAVLTALDPTVLPPAKVDQRLLLLARVRAGRGDPAGAAGLLSGLQTPASADLRAELFAKAGDWRDSLKALQQVTADTIADQGDLTEQQQDILLRQATAAVQAGDADAVRNLRRFEKRMKAPRADLFRLLISSAIESSDDLPRSAQELAMSRTLPERLDALRLK